MNDETIQTASLLIAAMMGDRYWDFNVRGRRNRAKNHEYFEVSIRELDGYTAGLTLKLRAEDRTTYLDITGVSCLASGADGAAGETFCDAFNSSSRFARIVTDGHHSVFHAAASSATDLSQETFRRILFNLRMWEEEVQSVLHSTLYQGADPALAAGSALGNRQPLDSLRELGCTPRSIELPRYAPLPESPST